MTKFLGHSRVNRVDYAVFWTRNNRGHCKVCLADVDMVDHTQPRDQWIMDIAAVVAAVVDVELGEHDISLHAACSALGEWFAALMFDMREAT